MFTMRSSSLLLLQSLLFACRSADEDNATRDTAAEEDSTETEGTDDSGAADSGAEGDSATPDTDEPIEAGEMGALLHTIYGEEANDNLGFRVRNLPDYDGDGISEIAIGAPYYKPQDIGIIAGAVVIFDGQQEGMALGQEDSQALIVAESAYDYFGQQLYSCDMDSDSLPELFVGSGNYETSGEALGAVFRYELPLSGEHSIDGATAAFVGPSAYSSFGGAIACVSGAQLLAIGASYDENDQGQEYAGSLLLFEGPFSGTVDHTAAIAEIQGDHQGQQLGIASSLADVNGDGIIDLMVSGGAEGVGGMGSGSAGVFYGPVSGLKSIADADALYREPSPGDSLGNTLLSGADINQDGYIDLAISSYHESTYARRAGMVYLLHGGTAGTPPLDEAQARFYGKTEYGYGGVSTAFLDDFSNDGRTDFAIGEYGARITKGGEQLGAVHVFLDASAGVYDFSDADLSIYGEKGRGGSFGYHIDALDDFDGDGLSDLLIGAYIQDSGAGMVYLYSGGNPEQ